MVNVLAGLAGAGTPGNLDHMGVRLPRRREVSQRHGYLALSCGLGGILQQACQALHIRLLLSGRNLHWDISNTATTECLLSAQNGARPLLGCCGFQSPSTCSAVASGQIICHACRTSYFRAFCDWICQQSSYNTGWPCASLRDGWRHASRPMLPSVTSTCHASDRLSNLHWCLHDLY